VRIVLRSIVGWGLASVFFSAFAGPMFPVPPELWDRPRSGQSMLEQPALKQAVNAYLAQSGASLLIHYAPGQDGSLQAEELRAWLTALAIDASRVRLRNDLKSGEPLTIEVVSAK